MAIFGKKDEGQEKTEAASEVSAVVANANTARVSDVLVQPRVSEKAGHLASLNQYVFKVKLDANKVEVKKAVESRYKVKVVGVNMVRMEGKKRNYGQTSGRMSDFKKAIVTLKDGDKIDTAIESV